ncbi:MAG: family 20 glycosylhydrolase [Bacteroides sp.]|nr:family 20 glycosylhydrolase [Bacteroides sp.]MCM1380075.1 family 20 glycosylhydrolase [Bacteroides sp.]MCM1446412.1 family 20 glycosylhydrolase [Prevotella sp.]
MKIKALIAAALIALTASAEDAFINLTPTPKSMTVGEGQFVLAKGFGVDAAGHDAEVDKFLADINRATGLEATKTNNNGVIRILDVDCAPAHFGLTVNADGVTIECASDEGLYYAFQTIKKLLPANVMAGVREEKEYALPVLTISDEPRFEYRGFMLDVSRHFFPVADIKRMLDVMSYYKMNKFHWHLADDQGWRIEMPQYPRLTTVGATAGDTRIVDMYTKTEYWLNKSYGPYYYTQEELRDVVEYAAERHIDIIPEVEFPGHFSAVMAAYPEFSLNPSGNHSVAVSGGVYGDVMNLANPGAIKFAEDVIDLLCDIFPSDLIHLGGDECPDGGWVKIDNNGNVTGGNEECIAMYKREGCTSPRQLQSILTKHLADYAATKGRTIGVWNESISAGGTDENLMKQTGATIWCWTGADAAVNKAVDLGLPAIYTPISKTGDRKGSFYINRSQDPNDPPANGYKCDDVKSVYNTDAFTTKSLRDHPELCYGVQGTFWCERVAYREYLEYLALPRLLAIAEIGWTAEANKDWESFQKRMSADRELLDYNDYKYSTYHMLDLEAETPATPEPLEAFEEGETYMFVNFAADFLGNQLADNGNGATVHVASPAWGNTLWRVAKSTANANGSYDIQLVNAATGKALSSVGAASGREAKPVNLGADAATVKVVRTTVNGGLCCTLSIGDDVMWTSPNGTIRAGESISESGVSPQQGSVWNYVKAAAREYVAVTAEGTELFRGTRSIPAAQIGSPELFAPEIKNYTIKDIKEQEGKFVCTYEKTAKSVTVKAVTESGAIIAEECETYALNVEPTISAPEIDGFTFVSLSQAVTDDAGDVTVTATYSTTAQLGAKEPAEAVTSIQPGGAYLIRDAHSDRNAWRCATTVGTVNGTKVASNLSPIFTWTFEGADGNYKVKNLATETYVAQLERSTTAKLNASGASFTWTYDTDHWNVKGANGMYWDGLDNLDLVGWNGGTGHPIEVYTFYAAPFHVVTIKSVDTNGSTLSTESRYAAHGETFVVGIPYRAGYTFSEVRGAESLTDITGDVEVTLVYSSDAQSEPDPEPDPTPGGDDEQDSIDELLTSLVSLPAVYDLQGRRITNPGRGVYIINNRKVLIK